MYKKLIACNKSPRSSGKKGDINYLLNSFIINANSIVELRNIVSDSETGELLKELNAVNVATAMHRIAKFKKENRTNVREIIANMPILEKLVQWATLNIAEFQSQGLANLSWGYAYLGIKNDKFFLALAQQAINSVSKVNSYNEIRFQGNHFTNKAWAMAVGISLGVDISKQAVSYLSLTFDRLIKYKVTLSERNAVQIIQLLACLSVNPAPKFISDFFKKYSAYIYRDYQVPYQKRSGLKSTNMHYNFTSELQSRLPHGYSMPDKNILDQNFINCAVIGNNKKIAIKFDYVDVESKVDNKGNKHRSGSDIIKEHILKLSGWEVIWVNIADISTRYRSYTIDHIIGLITGKH